MENMVRASSFDKISTAGAIPCENVGTGKSSTRRASNNPDMLFLRSIKPYTLRTYPTAVMMATSETCWHFGVHCRAGHFGEVLDEFSEVRSCNAERHSDRNTQIRHSRSA
jgi:hypothetical protein